jgi:hypothetical protein
MFKKINKGTKSVSNINTTSNFKINTETSINFNNNNNYNNNLNYSNNIFNKTNYDAFGILKKRMPLYFNLSLENDKKNFPVIRNKNFTNFYSNTFNNDINKKSNYNKMYQKYRIVNTDGDYNSINKVLYSKFKLSLNPNNNTTIYLLKGKNKFKKKIKNSNSNTNSLSLRIGVNYPFDLNIPPKIMSHENEERKKLTINFLEYITKKNAYREKIQNQLNYNDYGFRLKSQRRRNYNPLNV